MISVDSPVCCAALSFCSFTRHSSAVSRLPACVLRAACRQNYNRSLIIPEQFQLSRFRLDAAKGVADSRIGEITFEINEKAIFKRTFRYGS